MKARTSLPPEPLSEERVGANLAVGWARAIAKIGRGTFADAAGCCGETVGNALAGKNLPKLHTVLNSLRADPSALDEALSPYGFRLVPTNRDAANDLDTAAGVIAAMGQLVRANADGRRDHNETLAIAELLRPHLGAIDAIMAEADKLRGVA